MSTRIHSKEDSPIDGRAESVDSSRHGPDRSAPHSDLHPNARQGNRDTHDLFRSGIDLDEVRDTNGSIVRAKCPQGAVSGCRMRHPPAEVYMGNTRSGAGSRWAWTDGP